MTNTYVETIGVDVVFISDEFLEDFHATHTRTLEVPFH